MAACDTEFVTPSFKLRAECSFDEFVSQPTETCKKLKQFELRIGKHHCNRIGFRKMLDKLGLNWTNFFVRIITRVFSGSGEEEESEKNGTSGEEADCGKKEIQTKQKMKEKSIVDPGELKNVEYILVL